MNELVESMLPISARFSPGDWSGGVINTVATSRDVFSVGFHISLLKVCRKSVHVL